MTTGARAPRLRPGIARNTVVSGINTMLRLLVGFLLLPLLLDGIGAPQTGLFLFATTLTGYFTAVDVSVNSSVTRYVAEHRAREQVAEVAATVRSSLLVMTGFGVLAAAGLIVLAATAATAIFSSPAVSGTAAPTILVAAATSAVYWPSRIGVAALNGIERYDQSAQIQIVTSLLLLTGLGWLSHEHSSVVLLTALYGVITVAEGLTSAWLAWRPLGVSRAWIRGSWFGGEHLRAVFGFGAAAFLIGIGDTLINSFDRAIVGAVVGAAAIVGYDIAQRPTSAVRTFAGLSGLALVSPVARLSAEEKHGRMRDLVLIASLVSVIVTAPIAVLVMALSKPFVIAWLGTRYGHYAPYIVIFTSFWTFNCATAALSSALYGIGRLKPYAWITIVMAIISLPLSVGLTLAWGTVGVIWGTVIPASLAIPVFTWSSLRRLAIPAERFVRDVLVPGYGPLLLWSAPVIVVRLLAEPHGYVELVVFAGVALALYWGATVNLVRRRIAQVRAAPVGT